MMNLFSSQFNLLQKGLDASWKRAEVINGNIANADTPNYKARKVLFEDILKSELERGMPMKKSSRSTNPKFQKTEDTLEPVVITDYSKSMRLDGNNVDIENEMVDLAKNSILYQTLITKLSKEISMLKYAINEGRR